MYSQGYLALKRLECAMSVELSASTLIRLRSVISSISSLMKACIALKSDRAALSCKLCSEISWNSIGWTGWQHIRWQNWNG